MEACNLINGQPLLRDMPDMKAKRDRVESLVRGMIEEIKLKPEIMDRVKEMAKEKGLPLEVQTELAARWIVHDQIKQGIIKL